MNKTRSVSRIFAFICLLGTLNGQVRAQTPVGEIRGQVTDEHGSAIVGAKITLVSHDGSGKAVLTDQQGIYSFKSVVAGAYILRVLATGFAPYEQTDLLISRRARSLTERPTAAPGRLVMPVTS